ncbi:unnamed protein product [Gadus morhua 'NCC']
MFWGTGPVSSGGVGSAVPAPDRRRSSRYPSHHLRCCPQCPPVHQSHPGVPPVPTDTQQPRSVIKPQIEEHPGGSSFEAWWPPPSTPCRRRKEEVEEGGRDEEEE